MKLIFLYGMRLGSDFFLLLFFTRIILVPRAKNGNPQCCFCLQMRGSTLGFDSVALTYVSVAMSRLCFLNYYRLNTSLDNWRDIIQDDLDCSLPLFLLTNVFAVS